MIEKTDTLDDKDFRGNQPRSTSDLELWLNGEETVIFEPSLPIVDPHHHLFGSAQDRLFYRLEDLKRDLSCGHRILGTVYVEAYESGWRKSGPDAMRPVGEVEQIVALTRDHAESGSDTCKIAAGIVGHVDLTLGRAVDEVIAAQIDAGQGRLRGVRQRSAIVGGIVGRYNPNPRPAYLLSDAAFRAGFDRLKSFGLSFDCWIYHPQITELLDLADRFEDTVIIVNHMAGPIGVAEYRRHRSMVMEEWTKGIVALAKRPNIFIKIGGMGMPLFGLDFDRHINPASSDELALAWRIYIETCVAAFGTNRCMFESNFPVDKQSAGYRSVWNAFKIATSGWSLDERADLFFSTACRSYKLASLLNAGHELMGTFHQTGR